MLHYVLPIPLLLLGLNAITSAYQLLPPLNASQSESSIDFANVLISKTIYLDRSFATYRDSQGLTLIPPSALDFAQVFRQDLNELSKSNWTLQQVDTFPNSSGIFLEQYGGDNDQLTYANGITTEEGYEFDVQPRGAVFIRGVGARGMWWGTRTFLQLLVLSNQSALSIPSGRSLDAPAFATRGFMLDAGRKWYSPSFLKDLCTYASFFKMNEFHYHSSDNYPLSRGHNETWYEVYSQFALRPQNSSLDGLVQRKNETLSQDDFEDFQQHCAQRGVTVLTEIEAPGHALSITKWKPEVALSSTKDLLNLTHPETIPLIKAMWTDVLPRVHSKEIHIGADEYDSDLADDYIRFVNEMADFINMTSGKRTRIWGTYEPSPTNLTISKDIVIQHWQYGQSDPIELVRSGYDIVNSDDKWAYMSIKNDHVPISPAPYPQFFNETRVLDFGGQRNVQWDPSHVNSVNLSMQLDGSTKRNKGAIFAAWNDNGPDASTQLEAYYAIRRGVPLVAARAWSGSRGSPINSPDLDPTIDYLSPRVPGANLDRIITESISSDVANPLISWTSGNRSFPMTLGYGSKGMNYTLVLLATGPFTLSSGDASLLLSSSTPDSNDANSTGSLTFTSDNWQYPLRSTSYNDSTYFPTSPGQGRIWGEPPGNQTTSSHNPVQLSMPSKNAPMNITITTDVLRGSRCWINGSFVGRFEVLVYGGRNTYKSWSQMAFVAPVDVIEGTGLEVLHLWDRIIEPSDDGGKDLNGSGQVNSAVFIFWREGTVYVTILTCVLAVIISDISY